MNHILVVFVVLFSVLFYSTLCFSQSDKIIALQSELNTTVDTTKVRVLNALALEYKKNDWSKSIKYLEDALFISKNIRFQKGIGDTYATMGDVYFEMGYDKALPYYSKTLIIRETLGDKKGAAACLISLGNVNIYMGNYEEALNNYLKSLAIYENLGARELLPLNNIGASYYYMGNYEKALEYYVKALKTADVLGDKKRTINPLLGIGNVSMAMGNYDRALDSYREAMVICTNQKDKSGLSKSLNCLGSVFDKLHNNDTALLYYLKSLHVNKELNARSSIANSLMNVGTIYNNKKNYKKALSYYEEAHSINEELGNKNGRAITLLNIGILHSQTNELEKALNYLKKGLAIADSINRKELRMEGNANISEIYEKMGDYKLAYYYHKCYFWIKDTLLNEKSHKQIAEMQTKYDTEKKEKEIILLTKDKTLQQAEINMQKLVRNGSIGGLMLVLIFAFILLNRFYVTNRQKKIIQSQNFQILESINYSKKIQNSLLPDLENIQKIVPDFFVFYEPKDIVSGDFYWFHTLDKYTVLVCADCTGHGVPGGFMSTVGSLLLDKIVINNTLTPGEILNTLSAEIIRVLHQQNSGEIQDGIDLSVCVINRENSTISFSGARNGIIIVSGSQAKRYKADLLPAGGNYMKKGVAVKRNFKTQNISIEANDCVYMFTDGFVEQVGGEDGLPMNFTQFENILIHLSKIQTLESKKFFINAELEKWKGKHERVDDILILGFKVA